MITEPLSGFEFSIRSLFWPSVSSMYSTLITRGKIRKRIGKFESSDKFNGFGDFEGMMYIVPSPHNLGGKRWKYSVEPQFCF